jgi:hypothetical protein
MESLGIQNVAPSPETAESDFEFDLRLHDPQPDPERRFLSYGPHPTAANMSGLASKQQSLNIFEKLKSKPANKASARIPRSRTARTHTRPAY